MSLHAQLSASSRSVLGNSVRIMRRNGLTPAVIYSKSFPSTPLQINTNELNKIYKTAGKNTVIDLNIDGKIQTCIIHSIDTHPFKPIIRHVDFLVVDMKVDTESNVPIVIVGVSPAVKSSGAILNQISSNILISALPDKIPKVIEIDISTLKEFGDTIKIADLKVNQNYKFVDSPDTLLISLTNESEEIEVKEVLESEVTTEPSK